MYPIRIYNIIQIQYITFISGSILFSLCKQSYWWSRACFGSPRDLSREHLHDLHVFQGLTLIPEGRSAKDPHEIMRETFFTASDLQVLHNVKCFQHNPVALMSIALPSLMSLGFCPVALFLHEPMVKFFWSLDVFEFPPQINEVISAFLVPSGLVYAIAFGFALQDTILKLKEVSNCIKDHVSAIKQIAILTAESPYYSKTQKMAILINLKNSFTIWMRSKLMKEKVVKLPNYGMYSSSAFHLL